MLEITHFTDPVCPFAFSAEPQRLRLRWHYGEGLHWHNRMIVLTREEGEPEMLAEGAAGLQRKYGMPIEPGPYPRAFSSEPACLAVVAARLNAPGSEEALLRALRVRVMQGALADEDEVLAAAAVDAGLEAEAVAEWASSETVREALESDIEAARSPSPAALAFDHKLSGPAGERRYSAPSYEMRRTHGEFTISVPGFSPVEAYEAAVASLAPELERRPVPESVGELLEWAPYPLATAEVTAIAQIDEAAARDQLAEVAEPIPAGADFYWRPR